MTAPPSLTKSLVLRSRALPTPTTTRRVASSPRGATISSADPFLPLNLSAAAALVTRSPVCLTARRAADPNLSPSSQNRTRTPLAGVARGANSSLRAPDIGMGPLDRVQQNGSLCAPAGGSYPAWRTLALRLIHGGSAGLCPQKPCGRWATRPRLTFCCAYSKGLPWPSHF